MATRKEPAGDTPPEGAPAHLEKVNMDIWDRLKTTDPKHTKAFTRSGGFRGTAIKPIYSLERMTRLFGACGDGWGMTKPEFAVEGNLVFCKVGLWHLLDSGDRSDTIWGVGGDTLTKTQKGNEVSDDEAFKKAYTDALGNAMKHLGMSADVHMGQFEDSKYVQEAGADAEAEAKRRAFEEDRAAAEDILEDASAATSNAGIDDVLRAASHKIKAIQERNPGLITRLKGEIEKLRMSHADYKPKEDAA